MTKAATHGDVVFVLDASIRSALKERFQSVRLEVKTYTSGAAFLENSIPEARARAGVRPPSTSGLKFQEELARADVRSPWRHRPGIAPSAAGE